MIGGCSNEGISHTPYSENELPSYPAPLKRSKLFTERDQESLTCFADPHRAPATFNRARHMLRTTALWVCVYKHASRGTQMCSCSQ